MRVKFRQQSAVPLAMYEDILTALGPLTASEVVGLQLAPVREHGHLCFAA
jgi:hypothetical protein